MPICCLLIRASHAVCMQAKLSEEQASLASAKRQLQQQQELYALLQTASDNTEAAAAAATAAEQSDRSEQLIQQLQASLEESEILRQEQQSARHQQGRHIEGLTAELSAAKGSTESLQVSKCTSFDKNCEPKLPSCKS